MNQQQTYGPVADQRFPGLTRDQINRIEQVTASYTGMDKLKIQQQLYQQAINQIKNQQVTEERFGAKNDMYCRSLDKDSKQKTTDQCSVRLEDLADIVKNKYNLNANTDTNTVINGVVKMAQDKNVDTNLLNKYLDSGDKEFLYEMGFEEKPEEGPDYLGMATAYLNPVAYLANKAGKYFFEHPAEISVGAAQSPGKRGYNLIGQWIDRAGKALAGKLEGTELANTIKQSAIDMFGEEEVKKFAEQRQQELANGTAFNGRDATDIRTPLLGDKANSQATQVGETIGDIGTAIALSYPMAASLAPYMGLNTATQAGRTLLLGSGQGALDMAAYEYGANQEIASPTELGVGALIGAGTPFVVPMSSAIGKGVSNKYNDIMGAFKTASKEKLGEELRDLFSRGIKPSSAGIKTTSAQEKIYDDAMDAVETIINNKNNLKFTNANGEEIVGKLPTNTREFAQAIQQTKQNIYNQYNAIAQAAGKDTRVNVDELVDELLKLKNDKAALLGNEGLETSIDNWLRGLSEIKDLSVEQAQKKIQEINQKLDAFYKNPNPNDVSKSSVDALVKNKLAESLDNSIESALGSSSEYDSLKRAYSALKTIEKDVNHRAIVSGRQSPNSLVDSIADISSVESLLDVLSGSPVGAVKAIGKQALKKYIKGLNSSDNMVQKLFSKAEGELERSGTLKTNQQILRQQEREYQKWLSQGSNKNYLPYKEGVDDAGKTVIPGGERIAVTPEGNAVREGQINEVPAENINYVDNAAGQTKGINEGISKTTTSEDVSDLLPLNERVGGDDLLNAEDLIDEVKSVGAKVDENGYVTVYHQTTPEAAEQIRKTGKMSGKENGIFFSTSKDATQAEGRGTVKIELKIPAEKLQLDDIFTNNADVKILSKPGEEIDIGKYLVKDTGENSLKSKQLEIIQKSNEGNAAGEGIAMKDKLATVREKAYKNVDTVMEEAKASGLEPGTAEYDKVVGEKLYNEFKDSFDDLLAEHMKNNPEKANLIDPDELRYLVNDNQRLPAGITHPIVKELAERQYKKVVSELMKSGKKNALVMGGGSGAGKGFVRKHYKLAENGFQDGRPADIIVDKVSGVEEANELVKKGFDVQQYGVIPRAENVVLNISQRAFEQGRGLSIPKVGREAHLRFVDQFLNGRPNKGSVSPLELYANSLNGEGKYKLKLLGLRDNLVEVPGEGGFTKYVPEEGGKGAVEIPMSEWRKALEDYEKEIGVELSNDKIEKVVKEKFLDTGKIDKARYKELVTGISGLLLLGLANLGAEKEEA